MPTNLDQPLSPMTSPNLAVPEPIRERRAAVFLLLSGLFLGTLAMLNILGISRFVKVFEWGDVAITVAVGALPYPVTFLCTDLISELYGSSGLTRWCGWGCC